MFVIIDIYSKNRNSLKTFVNFFCDENLLLNLQVDMLKTKARKPTKKTVITVLKSPHVNKIAQEQFEYRVYKKQFKCFVPQILLFLIFFKKLRANLFSDIKFKFKIISNKKFETTKLKHTFNVDSYCLVHKELNLIRYLNLLTIYGESVLKLK